MKQTLLPRVKCIQWRINLSLKMVSSDSPCDQIRKIFVMNKIIRKSCIWQLQEVTPESLYQIYNSPEWGSEVLVTVTTLHSLGWKCGLWNFCNKNQQTWECCGLVMTNHTLPWSREIEKNQAEIWRCFQTQNVTQSIPVIFFHVNNDRFMSRYMPRFECYITVVSWHYLKCRLEQKKVDTTNKH